MAIRLKTRLLAAAAATGVMGLAPAALAQDAETRNGTPAELGEIVVTAQLREQDPIEVPFALTAYSGQFLEDLGVQEFDQLSAFVPGFLVQNQSPNNPGFVMRGITSDSGAATAEPRVSVFQDGVSISKSRGSYVELFDMERIEVAKGPQSTLYGRGALIGAVNLDQNRARPGRTEAYAQAEFGDEGYRMVEGALNLPVGETAGLRLATRMKTRDGYVDNLLGGEEAASRSRSPEIMADAAVAILSQPSADVNGQTFIDSEVLTKAGVTDLSPYGGGDDPILDIFVDERTS